MLIEILPVHECRDDKYFWCNDQWFSQKGIGPTRDQKACPGCRERWPDPKTFNLFRLEWTTKEYIEYPHWTAEKIDLRKFKGVKPNGWVLRP